ncbi:MAG: hypothetical protein R6V56_02900 [Lentisphaeria bacterium]
MAEELQALLDKINEQGIQKADEDRKQRLEKAEEEARKLIADAKDEADKIVSDAQKQADLLTEKGRDSLRQAARDTILSLRERLQDQIADLAEQAIAEDINPEALADFIADMVEEHSNEKSQTADIEIQIPDKDVDAIRKHLMARLGATFKDKCELTPLPEMEGGFKLSVQEGDVYYDFSDKALAEVLCTFLNPKLSEIVKPALTEDKEDENKNAE